MVVFWLRFPRINGCTVRMTTFSTTRDVIRRVSYERKSRAAGLSIVRISYFNTILFPVAALAQIEDKMFGSAEGTWARDSAPNNQQAARDDIFSRTIFTQDGEFALWGINSLFT